MWGCGGCRNPHVDAILFNRLQRMGQDPIESGTQRFTLRACSTPLRVLWPTAAPCPFILHGGSFLACRSLPLTKNRGRRSKGASATVLKQIINVGKSLNFGCLRRARSMGCNDSYVPKTVCSTSKSQQLQSLRSRFRFRYSLKTGYGRSNPANECRWMPRPLHC